VEVPFVDRPAHLVRRASGRDRSEMYLLPRHK
jgi:hypothetical protein